MRPQAFLLLAIAVPNFILGSFILLRNVRDRINIFFALFAFWVGFWALGLAGFILSNNSETALYWAQGYYIAAALIAVTFLAFSISFTGKWGNYSNREKLATLIPAALIIGLLLFYPAFHMNGIKYNDWGKEVILNGYGYLAYSVYFVIYVIPGFIIMMNALQRAKGVSRLYLKYVFIGLVLAFSFGATFNLLYPALGNYRYIWAGPLFTLLYISITSYAIIKHRLFDIRLFVARSLGYALSIFSIGAIYGLIAFSVVSGFAFNQSGVTLEQQVIYTILAVTIAFTFQPMKRFFDRFTNSIFYRDAYEPQQLLDSLNKVLVGTIELNELLSNAANVIGNTIKAEFTFFGIKEINGAKRRIIGFGVKDFDEVEIKTVRANTPKTKQKILVVDELNDKDASLRSVLRKNNIAVIVRLTDTPERAVEGLGYIVLGAKKSGNPYSGQDVKTLEIIADEMVIAIQNALRFEEIQNFAKTLEDKVDVATRDLRNANEKLKALDQTKDDFISMASHQLRTPLTSVKGYVSMVLEGDVGKVSKKQEQLLNQAFVSSQRMVYLIADLLNVSRLKTGKFVIEAKETNLSDVIEGEIAQLTETAKGRDLEVKYHKPKGFPALMLDETKIRQVIMNFADNAVYYTPAGGHIDIILEDKGETIEFRVEDDGIGVPKSEQHHLFNKFYRAGNAKKARPDGTGLGLFMAKKVVVAQGGAIIFKSTEGKGSVFGFSFAKKPLLPEHYKGVVAKDDLLEKPKITQKSAKSTDKTSKTKAK